MSVKLSAPGIPYLDRATIEEYSNLRFFSDKGELVRINPVILAAINSSLVDSLPDDYEESCVITEFSRNELESINEFSWTGRVNYDNANIFSALGIDLNHMFERKPPTNVEVKIKVKDEPLDFEHGAGGGNSFGNENKKKYKSDEFIDDDEEEEWDEGDDDYDWESDYIEQKQAKKSRKSYKNSNWDDPWNDEGSWPGGWEDEDWSKGGRPKKKRGPKGPRVKKEEPDEFDTDLDTTSTQLSEEQKRLYETWDLPKTLEEYRQNAQEPRMNEADKDNPLACHLCPCRFKIEAGLQAHLIKFHSEHYSCLSCYKAFAIHEIDKFKLHMFKHHLNILTNKSCCIQCGATFQRGNGLAEHLKLRGQYHDEECASCPEKFLSHEDYRNHVDAKHEGRWKWKCGFCRELFDEKRDLRSHFKTFHETGGSRPCQKKYVPKKTICVECGKLVYNLKNHMVSVHGNEKHPCPHCGLILKTHPRLQKHISWIHITAPCTECGEMVGVGKMSRHIEQKHTSIYDRKFKCDVCGKGFSDNTKLRDHKNVHTGEKPYKCKFCSACFASAGSHATHQKSHLGYRRSK